MKTKLQCFTEFLTDVLDSVNEIVKTCQDGENSINKRNNQLAVSVNFSFGQPKNPCQQDEIEPEEEFEPETEVIEAKSTRRARCRRR